MLNKILSAFRTHYSSSPYTAISLLGRLGQLMQIELVDLGAVELVGPWSLVNTLLSLLPSDDKIFVLNVSNDAVEKRPHEILYLLVVFSSGDINVF